MTQSPQIIVIGGGFAGLTAAVALTQRGEKVTLLERRVALGGRARSFPYDSDGRGDPSGRPYMVDNGQHVFLGCYRNTLQFLKTIGAEENLFFQESLQLKFRQRGGIESALRCPRLPSPWHLLLGLWGFRRLRFRDKWSALKIWGQVLTFDKKTNSKIFCQMSRLDPNPPNPLTVTEWLIQLGQSPLARESLWNPLVIAALNESPDLASANSFLKVLREAFATPEDSRIGLAGDGLSSLYADPAHSWLQSHGATVRLQANVEAIECREKEVVEVILTSGERLSADAYICAIPPRDLAAILPERMIESDPALQNLHHLKASPILSINLWLDRPIFKEPFVGLLGTKAQWVFNKSKNEARSRKQEEAFSSCLIPHASCFLYSCIISAAYEFLDQTNEELVTTAMDELRSCFPEVKDVNLVKSQVIREPHATLSSAPEIEKLRPAAKTSLKNLVLAGDWVQTGLPATIESAVLSGYQAAELIRE